MPACKARGSGKRFGVKVPLATRCQSWTAAPADLIVAVDGEPIKTVDDFLNAVEARHPGDQVVLTVIRGGQQMHIPLRLEAGD